MIVAVEKATLLLSLPFDHVIFDWRKKIQCIKAAVVCVTEDSESRNAGAQKELVREKEGQSYLSFQMGYMLRRENGKVSQIGFY